MATIFIKNMVCNRCIMAVRDTLEAIGLPPNNLQLGEATFDHELSGQEKDAIEKALIPLGFALIDDRKSRLIALIKTLIIELVHHNDNELRTNLSDYLSQHLHHEYNYLSNLFSEVEGNTIEKYYIAQKIERVKELLVYDELSLSEIADQLHYSSVAHLSNQFKKVTGLTPSYFKQIRLEKRKPLDEV
ncbi:MAG: helix-turn-helix transcriptional regulator [Chitinophagales bacterium]|nr:helix-turn-helix transcriptional regulator [Chitinophagales bacterium]